MHAFVLLEEQKAGDEESRSTDHTARTPELAKKIYSKLQKIQKQRFAINVRISIINALGYDSTSQFHTHIHKKRKIHKHAQILP